MAVYGCPELKESQRNWGRYITLLRERFAPEKVLHHLEQMKDLHRNPLIHPDTTLTSVQAMGLWAIAGSVIQAMVSDMESKLPVADQDPEIVGMLPPADDIWDS
jgi:hypothetical protein